MLEVSQEHQLSVKDNLSSSIYTIKFNAWGVVHCPRWISQEHRLSMKEDLPLIIYDVRLNLEGLYTVWDAYPKNTDSGERRWLVLLCSLHKVPCLKSKTPSRTKLQDDRFIVTLLSRRNDSHHSQENEAMEVQYGTTYGRCDDRIRNTPQLDMSDVHNHTQYHVQRGTRLRPHSDDAKMDQ